MAKPSPDLDLITLKWAGTYLDGSPAKGSLQLTYGGGVMLDDDTVTPINIFPKQITVPITTLKVDIGGEMKDVGYAEMQVPATNDPDIVGGGGTYSLTENLLDVSSGRKNIPFPVDYNTPDGVLWLNKIIPTAPSPGQTISVVYWDSFQSLDNRVAALELGGGGNGGGVTSYNDLTDKPSIPTRASDIDAQPAGDYVATTDPRLSDSRTPMTHAHTIASVTGLQGALDGKQPSGSYATSTELASGLDGKSNTGHTHSFGDISAKPSTYPPATHSHGIADVTGLQSALDAKGTSNLTLGATSATAKAGDYLPSLSDLPAGLVVSVNNIDGTQARPTSRIDIHVQWIGGTVEPANALINDTWLKDVE